MKMTYDQLMGTPFAIAFQKVSQHSYPTKIAYTIKKFGDELMKHRKRISAEYNTLIQGFAKKDEKGEFIHPESNPHSYDIADDQAEAFKAAEKAFGETEINFGDLKQMPGHWLASMELSPAETFALETVFDFESDVKSEIAPTGNIFPMAAK